LDGDVPAQRSSLVAFFEYIANILYAAGVRKFPNRVLGILVLLAACFLVHVAVTSPRSGLIGGWSLDRNELQIGFARVAFPFLPASC